MLEGFPVRVGSRFVVRLVCHDWKKFRWRVLTDTSAKSTLHCHNDCTAGNTLPVTRHSSLGIEWFISSQHLGWCCRCSQSPLLDFWRLSSNQYKGACVNGNTFINFAALKKSIQRSKLAPWCQRITKGACRSLLLPHCAPWPGSCAMTWLS